MLDDDAKNAGQHLYAGLSHITYKGGPAALGLGVTLSATYAHLFAPAIMAFARAPAGEPHPPPWRAAEGAFGFDIECELAIPTDAEFPGGLGPEDVAWLITTLLRLAFHPYLMIPVLSDQSLSTAATTERPPKLRLNETAPRVLQATEAASIPELVADQINWVRAVWERTAVMMRTCPPFGLALRAADAVTIRARPAAALLTAWGALEELFAPSRTELRFRVSASIAAFLEPVGPERLEVLRAVAGLYTSRSKAAHSARDVETPALLQSFAVLRNTLIRMIGDGAVPTATDLERLLFCGPDDRKPSLVPEGINQGVAPRL